MVRVFSLSDLFDEARHLERRKHEAHDLSEFFHPSDDGLTEKFDLCRAIGNRLQVFSKYKSNMAEFF